MKKWLKERLDVLFPRLQAAQSEEEIKQLCIQEIENWRARPTMKSHASLKTPMTDTRIALEALPLTSLTTWIDPKDGEKKHLALKWMNFSEQEWREIAAPSEARFQERQEQRQFIDKPGEVVRRAEGLLQSDQWEEITVGLAAVSGRRLAEILKTGKFFPKSLWTVLFEGQLKQKTRVLAPYEIPTLVPADQVLDAWKRLRALIDCSDLEVTKVSEKYSRVVGEVAERCFADLIPQRPTRDGDLFTHLFRSCYGRIACHWFAPKEVWDINYMARIAGHWWTLDAETREQKLNFGSTLHYFDYLIGDGQGNIDGRQGIRLGEPGVKILDAYVPKEKEEGVPASAGRKGRRKTMLDTPAQEAKPKESKTGYGMLKPTQATQARVIGIGREEKKRSHDEILSMLCDEHYELRQLVDLLKPLAAELQTSSPVETLRLLITAPDRAGSRLVDQQFSEKYGTSLSAVEALLSDVAKENEKPVEHLREVMTKRQTFREKKEQRESGKDYQAMPFSELRGYKTDKAALERFRRAVQAIMHYNDRTDIQEESRWFINPAAIIDLVGGRHADIKAYLEAHQEEIDAHHKKYGLSAKFNRKPIDIKKRVIIAEEPSGLFRYQADRDEAERKASEE